MKLYKILHHEEGLFGIGTWVLAETIETAIATWKAANPDREPADVSLRAEGKAVLVCLDVEEIR